MTLSTTFSTTGPTTGSTTLFEHLWNRHLVVPQESDPALLYVDLHLVHEASSPQAFEGLRLAGRRVRRPDLTLAVEDHNVPTDSTVIRNELSRKQVEALRANCAEQGVTLLRLGNSRQGIVHVVAPELGLVQPGMTVVCGDSHTSTLGAFGALAFGIGTSDVEHVLATQSISLAKPLSMAVDFTGTLPRGATAKDLMLALMARIGANGARGCVVEYRGEAVERLSMEGRMTVCNLTVEAGARAGLIAPDETTFRYLEGRPHSPAGAHWEQALDQWRGLRSGPDAPFDRRLEFDASTVVPYVTWGTNPGQAVPIDAAVPDPGELADPAARAAAEKALRYMDLRPGTPMREVRIDTVFLGSCTNGRIEDLREAAEVLRGRTVAAHTTMLVVPGSMAVRRQAEREGLHEVFQQAGAEWRLPGCSMCVAINGDQASPGERVASTSNRNYEGRQGAKARTHLVSPATAAATAVSGRIAAPDEI
ncbi:3-isopropylmalate dehydratase large subunit [Kitasatospora viridis]|uniref:3-isopropylmalate dehydratase large subunit n=1 Tax=Kitasatospora viridis TaxID=281105 RepID=A0A561T654_9ACTN|nr:3-isopropylmalate dehydratase large subunit [Kitasatospora viridis]TWF82592.1 3-isopropylmalate/(R)-2-methylmalate dehydratase large subunit [Kitasatospora viridis]